jgi:hypothetical protein
MSADDIPLDEQAYQLYPALRNYGFQFIDSRGSADAGGRMSETYPADETDNPMPGKPTIQQFNPSMSPHDFLGETLHVLPKVDMFIGKAREAFVQSMTPKQQEQLQQQYEHAQQNEGEVRPFSQWRDVSGIDAWFRGNIAKQWPDEMYTQHQLDLFDKVKKYLQK